jgi:hypothetical protein
MLPLFVCLLRNTCTKLSHAVQIATQTGLYFPGVFQSSGVFDGSCADNCSSVILAPTIEVSKDNSDTILSSGSVGATMHLITNDREDKKNSVSQENC